MPTREQIRYQKAIDGIIRRYERLENDTIRRLIRLLKDLRKDIADIMLSTSAESEVINSIRLMTTIGQAINEFERKAKAMVSENFTAAFGYGSDSVTAPLVALGYTVAPINDALLNTLLDFSASLITNITAEMRGQIDRQIRLAALGGRTPFQAMKEITDILGVKAKDGIWGTFRRPEVVKGVAARAEAILRTELTRVYNMSHQAAANQAAGQIPGLMKRWIATGDRRTRRSHLRAHIDTATSPIPYNQPFQVGANLMMFPGDPLAGAEETVNCRCTLALVVPGIEMPASDLDKAVARQLAKQKEKA